jgi:hypothetical protein
MKPSRLRYLTPLLLVCYLLGGHAAAHGLSWCLAADDHAHLEQVGGACADTDVKASCAAEATCAPVAFGVDPQEHGRQSDCHHLPVTSPHHSSAKQRLARADGDTATTAIIAPTIPALPDVSVSASITARHQEEHLPPLQALVALSTIVLTC